MSYDNFGSPSAAATHTSVLVVKLFNHEICVRLRVKDFVRTASKNGGDYFSLGLYAQWWGSRKMLLIAIYLLFNPASDELIIRR